LISLINKKLSESIPIMAYFILGFLLPNGRTRRQAAVCHCRRLLDEPWARCGRAETFSLACVGGSQVTERRAAPPLS
jgi:hypothetical protein